MKEQIIVGKETDRVVSDDYHVLRCTSDGVLMVYDPATCVAEGTTTANGNLGGTTVIDTTRTEPNDHWNGMALLITSGTQSGQLKEIVTWVLGTGTFTVAPAFGGQILTDVTYKILAHLPADIDVAAIEAKLGEILDAEAEEGAVLPRLLWLKNGVRRGTGTILPVNTSLYDWILTRAVPGDAMSLTPAERLIVQALILNDATPFPGANIDAAISTRAPIVPKELLIKFPSDASQDNIAAAGAQTTTELPITVTVPGAAPIVRVMLAAFITILNNTATAHKIDIDVDGRIAAGAWNTYFSENTVVGFPAVDGATTGLVALSDVTALVAAAGNFGFRLTVTQSGGANSVIYTVQFLLVVTYGAAA